ncbi:hypothetical protein FRC0549_01073 [Corynebacterium diphtheriae]|nr:hypothetical protein FRC0549_01073 [Corynebacterium diphtheriae]
MNPIIIDADTGRELWNSTACAHHTNITPRTWANYYANNRTPNPVTTWGKSSPLWDAEEVKTWHANRPGSPVKNNPTTHSKPPTHP